MWSCLVAWGAHTHRMMRLHLIVLLLVASSAMRVPSLALLSRRRVAAAASALAVALPLLPARARAAGSLTDEQGRYVVDPKRAAAGLEDPLAEPTGAYSTISAAVAVAPSGATILVRPGTYTERVRLTRSVKLLADKGAVLNWKSDKPYEAALTIDLSEAAGASQVLVEGLAVTHFSPSIAQNYGVYVPALSAAANAESRIELRGCQVSSGSGNGVGIEGGDVTLSSCLVSGCKYHGVVFVGPTARGAMRDCLVEKSKLNGVLVRDGAYPTLEGNQWVANGQYGLQLVDCRSRQYEKNAASKNGKGAVGGECEEE